MAQRHELGKAAEVLALGWFLANRPSQLLAKNYRSHRGEIDLIFEEHPDNGSPCELVFVEVRSRISSKNWMNGAESLSLSKQNSLRTTADRFLMSYRGRAKSVRFDLMYWDGASWMHMPNMLQSH